MELSISKRSAIGFNFSKICKNINAMIDTPNLLKIAFITVMMLGFQACSNAPIKPTAESTAQPSTKAIPANYFLPAGIFKRTTSNKPSTGSAEVKETSSFVDPRLGNPSLTSDQIFKPLNKQVILYASAGNGAFLAAAGIDAKINLRVWEQFLRKYKIPFQTISSVEKLESSIPGVLVLPTSVALSTREKQAVTKFRALGGSLLTTWLTGVRNESGAWQGFDFMENTLGVKVLGDTEHEEEVNFLMPYGGTPIIHSLPVGQRIWLERVKGIYPLQLQGQQTAAKILDWSRISGLNQAGHTLVFGEQAQASGALSRSVAMGYPEHLWRSAEPKAMEAIAHNALMWLMRLPDVYLSTWPAPYKNALTVAVNVLEVVDDVDLKFASAFEQVRVPLSYFVMATPVTKSAENLKKLQAKGNEIAYQGDKFEGFKGQSEVEQSDRLKKMLKDIADAGFPFPAQAGFQAPIESQDATTEKLLAEMGFSYYISFMDRTDAREPFATAQAQPTAMTKLPMVVLPRTITPPEDAIEQDPENGLKQFFAESDLSTAAGALSVVRFPNQSLLTPEELGEITAKFADPSKKTWTTTTGQVVSWWRERQRLQIDLDTKAGVARLTVNLAGSEPLHHPASVLINLPYPHDSLRIVPDGHTFTGAQVTSSDPWRAAVNLAALKPGQYSWLLYFDRHATPIKN
ncbi:MAG: hypothetical protein FD135_4005 [Comamonadaceae bacterium]|nr:MAG: hypothetical protein FD135_4005 [Comamonadaceae bacterium]